MVCVGQGRITVSLGHYVPKGEFQRPLGCFVLFRGPYLFDMIATDTHQEHSVDVGQEVSISVLKDLSKNICSRLNVRVQ